MMDWLYRIVSPPKIPLDDEPIIKRQLELIRERDDKHRQAYENLLHMFDWENSELNTKQNVKQNGKGQNRK